ncbi:TrbI/VirB10 family protein [Vibrio breoganii]
MNDFLSKYLTPSQMSKAYMVGGAIIILVVAVTLMNMLGPEQAVRKTQPKVENLITTKNARDFGLDAVNDKVTDLNKQYLATKDRVDVLTEENKVLKANSRQSVALARELQAALKEINTLKEQNANTEKLIQERVEELVRYEIGEAEVSTILGTNNTPVVPGLPNNTEALTVQPERRTVKNGQFSYGGGSASTSTSTSNNTLPKRTLPTKDNPTGDADYKPNNRDTRTEILFSVIEDPTVEEVVDELEIYLPKGSILTGVMLTGLDAPTATSAQNNPVPLLVRLKKEAILPNFYTLDDVRECFALMAGYGDLSSERAFIRGEAITCVRHDGTVIERDFKGFAVGEDGKNGLKGTLVTRNSTILANAMMAGFAAGMASMFDVNPVPVISTTSDGSQQYQDVWSSDALQGGAAKGASEAMTRLADYYMSLADAMYPVIEIGGGRLIDIVITDGASI